MYVVVSGIPGSGKTTIAEPLARALGWPLLSKDVIKETLWDTLGAGDRAWSRTLGAAAMELLWRTAADAPDAVLDAFVYPEQRDRLRALPGTVVEVHCTCAPDLARARFVARTRHPCHFDAQLVADEWERWLAHDAQPLAVGHVIQVDTTDVVDITALAERVSAGDRR